MCRTGQESLRFMHGCSHRFGPEMRICKCKTGDGFLETIFGFGLECYVTVGGLRIFGLPNQIFSLI
jgi:hypothetical protein